MKTCPNSLRANLKDPLVKWSHSIGKDVSLTWRRIFLRIIPSTGRAGFRTLNIGRAGLVTRNIGRAVSRMSTRGSPNTGRVDLVEKKKVNTRCAPWLLVALEGTCKGVLEEIFKVASDVTCKVVSVVKTCKDALEERRICKGALEGRRICKGALEERKIYRDALEGRRTLCKAGLDAKRVLKAVLDAKRVLKAVLDARKSKEGLVVTSCREDSDEKRRSKVALVVKRRCKVVSGAKKTFKDGLGAKKKRRDALGGTKLRRMTVTRGALVARIIALQS